MGEQAVNGSPRDPSGVGKLHFNAINPWRPRPRYRLTVERGIYTDNERPPYSRGNQRDDACAETYLRHYFSFEGSELFELEGSELLELEGSELFELFELLELFELFEGSRNALSAASLSSSGRVSNPKARGSWVMLSSLLSVG